MLSFSMIAKGNQMLRVLETTNLRKSSATGAKLLDRKHQTLRCRHYSWRTERIIIIGSSGSYTVTISGIRRVFTIRWMGFEKIKGGHVLPIRIRCRDKPADRQQAIESKRFNTPSERNPKECYTDRKPEIRMLCGSI